MNIPDFSANQTLFTPKALIARLNEYGVRIYETVRIGNMLQAMIDIDLKPVVGDRGKWLDISNMNVYNCVGMDIYSRAGIDRDALIVGIWYLACDRVCPIWVKGLVPDNRGGPWIVFHEDGTIRTSIRNPNTPPR